MGGRVGGWAWVGVGGRGRVAGVGGWVGGWVEGRGCGGGGEWWVGEEGGRGREKNEGGRVAVGGLVGRRRGRVGGPAGWVCVGVCGGLVDGFTGWRGWCGGVRAE